MAQSTDTKCVNDGRTALVRHLEKGWLCVECAAKEGNPLALQLQTVRAVEKMLDAVSTARVLGFTWAA